VIRALRWVLLVVILGGAAILVLAVDFGGATLLDRMLGRKPSQTPREAPATEGDQLTGEDRQVLDRLIESKLKEKKEGEVSP
jgi:hypothetical protein